MRLLLFIPFILLLLNSGNAQSLDGVIVDTPKSGTVTDIDGNEYTWQKFGEQLWMTQNLRSSRYADGTPIPHLKKNSEWDTLSEYDKAFCFYDTSNTGYSEYSEDIFGALYTWSAATNGEKNDSTTDTIQGACPDGWHIPSDKEWTQLERYLAENGYAYDNTIYDGTETDREARSKIAKAMASNSGWHSNFKTGKVGNSDFPNKRNSSGFNAVPAGYRHYNGLYGHIGAISIWWSSSEYSSDMAWFRYLGYDYSIVNRRSYDKDYGISVRCVCDCDN